MKLSKDLVISVYFKAITFVTSTFLLFITTTVTRQISNVQQNELVTNTCSVVGLYTSLNNYKNIEGMYILFEGQKIKISQYNTIYPVIQTNTVYW